MMMDSTTLKLQTDEVFGINQSYLYNGKEPNIAFRIDTFKGILAGISNDIGPDKLAEVLTNTGRLAGTGFAKSLREIYNSDVATKKARQDWDELSVADKLNQWAEYDSATGWGILTCEIKNDNIKIVVIHLKGLFDGDGGLMFGYFLAGYAETIISYTIDSHQGGKFREYSKAVFLKTHKSGGHTIELNYRLE